MRVDIQRLSENSQPTLAPVYLLFGEELLLIEEACSALRKQAHEQGYTERVSHVVEQGFDWNELLQSGSSMSLFSERQLIEVRIPTGKPGQVGGKVLAELSENLSEDTMLMVVCGAVERAAQKQKWFKALEDAGVSAEARALPLNAFPSWLAGRLRSRGLLADRDSINLLTYYFEGNLLAAAQAIDLLALNTSPDSKLSADRQLALLQDSVSDNSRFSVFHYIDACLAGDWQRASRIIDGLHAESDGAVLLIIMLAREIRNLLQIAGELDRGANRAQVYKKYRVWRNREAIVNRAIEKHGVGGLQSFLQQIAKLDKILKGRMTGEGESVWFDIEKLSMRICGLELV
jgi:DNA polymerase-3 subunit delta